MAEDGGDRDESAGGVLATGFGLAADGREEGELAAVGDHVGLVVVLLAADEAAAVALVAEGEVEVVADHTAPVALAFLPAVHL